MSQGEKELFAQDLHYPKLAAPRKKLFFSLVFAQGLIWAGEEEEEEGIFSFPFLPVRKLERRRKGERRIRKEEDDDNDAPSAAFSPEGDSPHTRNPLVLILCYDRERREL